jgi:trans-aconitate methyltransferase
MPVRIFEGTNHANLYSKFRPIVPNNVIDCVLEFLREEIDSNQWDRVVDVGCGSGQGTNKLSQYFKQGYGFDVSPAQINEANNSKHSKNISYGVSFEINEFQIFEFNLLKRFQKPNSFQLLHQNLCNY